jgi:hypothetical protein
VEQGEGGKTEGGGTRGKKEGETMRINNIGNFRMENVDSPRACKEVGKYQRKGMLAAGSSMGGLDLPRATRERLASIGNHGLSRSTWSNYRTAETMLRRIMRFSHCPEIMKICQNI